MKRLIFLAVVLFSIQCSMTDSAVRTGRGMKLFAMHCSDCHGVRGVGQDPGHPEGLWLDNGRQLAPALNGSGYVWMYPPELIFQKISVGLLDEKSAMPAYEDIFSDGEIEMVITYLCSLWPEETRRRYLGTHRSSPLVSKI